MTTDRPSRTALLVLLAALLLLGGCTSEPAPAPSPSPSPSPSALARNDPDREALAAAVEELQTTVAALRASLEAAAAGDASGLATAVELLVAEPAVVLAVPPPPDDLQATPDAPEETTTPDATPGPAGSSGPAPILPGPLASREQSIEYGDLLTFMLGAARGAGSVGEPALRFLADPLAGDLGAWQRAPDDQLDAIARAGTAPDLVTTEAAVLELVGEAPRALAWVVHGLTVPADAEEAAGRALAHLAIIELTLEQLT